MIDFFPEKRNLRRFFVWQVTQYPVRFLAQDVINLARFVSPGDYYYEPGVIMYLEPDPPDTGTLFKSIFDPAPVEFYLLPAYD
jgi:hypothetical protein